MPPKADNSAKAAEPKAVDLNKKETALLAAFVEHNKEQVSIDWDKVAQKIGYSSSKNAILAFSRLKNKIFDPPAPATAMSGAKPGPAKGAAQAVKGTPKVQKKAAEPPKPAAKAKPGPKPKGKAAKAPTPPADELSDEADQESDNEAGDEDEEDNDDEAEENHEHFQQKISKPAKSSAKKTPTSKTAIANKAASAGKSANASKSTTSGKPGRAAPSAPPAASKQKMAKPAAASEEPRNTKTKASTPHDDDTEAELPTKKSAVAKQNSPKKKASSFTASTFKAQNAEEHAVAESSDSDPQGPLKPKQDKLKKPGSHASSAKGPLRGFPVADDFSENPLGNSRSRSADFEIRRDSDPTKDLGADLEIDRSDCEGSGTPLQNENDLPEHEVAAIIARMDRRSQNEQAASR